MCSSIQREHCFTISNPYHPWFVAEIVDRVQRINTWQPCVLKSNDYIPVVSVPVHAESMLSDQHKVWPNGSETEYISKILNCTATQAVYAH